MVALEGFVVFDCCCVECIDFMTLCLGCLGFLVVF